MTDLKSLLEYLGRNMASLIAGLLVYLFIQLKGELSESSKAINEIRLSLARFEAKTEAEQKVKEDYERRLSSLEIWRSQVQFQNELNSHNEKLEN